MQGRSSITGRLRRWALLLKNSKKRGARIKKKLVVDAVEAETVKLIFNLYSVGDGKSGPIGVKAIACWLNERRHRSRTGGRFGTGTVHKILTNSVYVGK